MSRDFILSVIDNPIVYSVFSQHNSELSTPVPPPVGFFIIAENGDNIITEDNDYLITEG